VRCLEILRRVRQNGCCRCKPRTSRIENGKSRCTGWKQVRKQLWTLQSRGYRESTRYAAPRPAETPLLQQMTRTPSTSWARVQGSAASRWSLSGFSAGGFPSSGAACTLHHHAQRCFSLRGPPAEPATGSAQESLLPRSISIILAGEPFSSSKYPSTLVRRHPAAQSHLPIVILKLGPLPASPPSRNQRRTPSFFPHTPPTLPQECDGIPFRGGGFDRRPSVGNHIDDSPCTSIPLVGLSDPTVCLLEGRQPVVLLSTAKIEIASPYLDSIWRQQQPQTFSRSASREYPRTW